VREYPSFAGDEWPAPSHLDLSLPSGRHQEGGEFLNELIVPTVVLQGSSLFSKDSREALKKDFKT